MDRFGARRTFLKAPAVIVSVSYDAATTAWVNAVVSAGGSVSDTQKGRVDSLVVGLKADSLWTKLDRMYLYGGEPGSSISDTKQGLVSLPNPGSTISTVNGSVTAVTGGYTGDGSTGYIDTGFNPTSGTNKFLEADLSFGAYIRTSRTTIQEYSAIGLTDFSNFICLMNLRRDTGSANTWAASSNSQSFFANANVQGFWCATAPGASSQILYKNGVSTATDTQTSRPLISGNFYALGNNFVGTGLHSPSADQIALTFIGGSLDATAAANLYTRVQNYMTAWSINV